MSTSVTRVVCVFVKRRVLYILIRLYSKERQLHFFMFFYRVCM
jgi:hypothetical protein